MHGKLSFCFNWHWFALNTDVTLRLEAFTELSEVSLTWDSQCLRCWGYPCVERLWLFSVLLKLVIEATSVERWGWTWDLGILWTFVFPKSHLLLRFITNTKVQFLLEEVPWGLLHLLLVLGVDYLKAAWFRGMNDLWSLDERIPAATAALDLQRLDYVI